MTEDQVDRLLEGGDKLALALGCLIYGGADPGAQRARAQVFKAICNRIFEDVDAAISEWRAASADAPTTMARSALKSREEKSA